jgi:integrase
MQKSVAAFALEFVILTATRSSEALGARWVEFDLANKVWTIPPERMKAGLVHRVPLSGRSMAVLERLQVVRTGEHVWPATLQRALKPRPGDGIASHERNQRNGSWLPVSV